MPCAHKPLHVLPIEPRLAGPHHTTSSPCAAPLRQRPNHLSSTPTLPSTATSRALSKKVLNNIALNNSDKHTQPSWRCNSCPSVSNGSKAHPLSKRSCCSHRSTGTKSLPFLGDLPRNGRQFVEGPSRGLRAQRQRLARRDATTAPAPAIRTATAPTPTHTEDAPVAARASARACVGVEESWAAGADARAGSPLGVMPTRAVTVP